MKRYIQTLALVYLGFMILANCSGTQHSFHEGLKDGRFDNKPHYTALVLLPLSGADEKLGRSMQQAAEMAFFDLGSDHFGLRFIDTKGDPKALEQALSQLDGKSVDLIIGPIRSEMTESAKKFSKKHRLPMLSFSNNTSIADSRTYIMGFTPEDQVQKIIQYALEKGHRKFGALLPDSPYGKIVLAAMENNIKMAGETLEPFHQAPPLEVLKPLTPEDLMIEAIKKYIRGERDLTALDLDKFEESNPLEDALPPRVALANRPYPHIVKSVFYKGDITALQTQVKEFAEYDGRKEAFQRFLKPYAFLIETGETLLKKEEAAGPNNYFEEDKAELSEAEQFVQGLMKRYGIRAYYANKHYFEAHSKDETDEHVDYDAILMADTGKRMQTVAALLPYYEITPKTTQFLGTGLWDDDGLGEEWALRGGLFAAPDPTAQNQFEKRYKRLYGEGSIRLNSLAYDAVALASFLTRTHVIDPFDRSYLLDPSGFIGIDGLFHFNQDGTIERSLVIMRIGKDRSYPIT